MWLDCHLYLDYEVHQLPQIFLLAFPFTHTGRSCVCPHRELSEKKRKNKQPSVLEREGGSYLCSQFTHVPPKPKETSPTPSSREGERGGRNELSGCGPRLRERTQGPATARKPPHSPPAWRAQALLPETARIRAHCLCTTRSSREVEPEEEGRGGEGWGEGRPASSPSTSPWKLPLGF